MFRLFFWVAFIFSRLAHGAFGADVADPQVESDLHEWEAGLHAPVKWEPLKVIRATSRRGKLEWSPDGSLRAPLDLDEKEAYTITGTLPFHRVTAFRLEVLPEGGAVGRAGNAVLSEFRVSATKVKSPLVIAVASADFEAEGCEVANALDGKSETGWSLAGSTDKAHAAVFALAKPLVLHTKTQLTFVLRQETGGQLLNRVRITATTAPLPVRELPEALQRTLALEPSERSDAQRAELAEYFRTQSKARAPTGKPASKKPRAATPR